MSLFDGQGRAGGDFQSGLKPFSQQMFYSRRLSEEFPDRQANAGHSPCSWVTHMGSGVSGRRELEGKSHSLRVSSRGNWWKGPHYPSSWGSQGNSENVLGGKAELSVFSENGLGGRDGCWKGMTDWWAPSEFHGGEQWEMEVVRRGQVVNPSRSWSMCWAAWASLWEYLMIRAMLLCKSLPRALFPHSHLVSLDGNPSLPLHPFCFTSSST